MQLFYQPELTETSTECQFDKNESRHIVKVLRKKTGDRLQITNGNGWLFSAEIVSDNIKNCTAEITEKTFTKKPDFNLHLAVAPTKMNDRYEWFLEKATEIGVTEITPVFCDHSERKKIKLERYEKVLQSAMKQSLHYYLPKLNEAVAFKDFVGKQFNGQTFIAHCLPAGQVGEETEKKALKNELKTGENVTILIGPEGDFSTQEIDLALQNGFVPVTLGNTRLRTETAGIVACHSVVFINS